MTADRNTSQRGQSVIGCKWALSDICGRIKKWYEERCHNGKHTEFLREDFLQLTLDFLLLSP
jgi:hypothetical protein